MSRWTRGQVVEDGFSIVPAAAAATGVFPDDLNDVSGADYPMASSSVPSPLHFFVLPHISSPIVLASVFHLFHGRVDGPESY